MITCSILVLIYFLPTLIAANRGHAVTGILLLNLLFGWTCIGWIALLLWALLLSAPRYILVAPPTYAPHYWHRP